MPFCLANADWPGVVLLDKCQGERLKTRLLTPPWPFGVCVISFTGQFQATGKCCEAAANGNVLTNHNARYEGGTPSLLQFHHAPQVVGLANGSRTFTANRRIAIW